MRFPGRARVPVQQGQARPDKAAHWGRCGCAPQIHPCGCRGHLWLTEGLPREAWEVTPCSFLAITAGPVHSSPLRTHLARSSAQAEGRLREPSRVHVARIATLLRGHTEASVLQSPPHLPARPQARGFLDCPPTQPRHQGQEEGGPGLSLHPPLSPGGEEATTSLPHHRASPPPCPESSGPSPLCPFSPSVPLARSPASRTTPRFTTVCPRGSACP